MFIHGTVMHLCMLTLFLKTIYRSRFYDGNQCWIFFSNRKQHIKKYFVLQNSMLCMYYIISLMQYMKRILLCNVQSLYWVSHYYYMNNGIMLVCLRSVSLSCSSWLYNLTVVLSYMLMIFINESLSKMN